MVESSERDSELASRFLILMEPSLDPLSIQGYNARAFQHCAICNPPAGREHKTDRSAACVSLMVYEDV